MSQSGSDTVIQAREVCVRRGEVEALRGVSFSITAGECVAIVGPNGAGKTTLMLAVLGLVRASSGAILIRGKALADFRNRREIARELAYVPQQYTGFVGFTVQDMVASGRYVHAGPLAPHTAQDLQIIDQALTACGLTHLRDRIVASLSAGERQKVHLAAAIAQHSPMLCLDEPTSALDPRHQRELSAMLRRFHELDKTLLVICHDLNLAALLNARVLALKNGRLVFDGSSEEFLGCGSLEEVFDTQFQHWQLDDGSMRVLPRE